MHIDVAKDEEDEDVFYVADRRGDWIAGPYLKRERAEARLAALEEA